MFHHIVQVFCVFIIVFGTGRGASAAETKVSTSDRKTEVPLPHWRAPASCGVSCCYALLKLSGLSPSYDDVARLVPVEGTGSNFYTMNHACRQLGLNTEIIAAAPAEFEKIRWPAIVHYRPMGAESHIMGHFVIVVGIDDHWVHILDAGYANSTLRIPRGDFFRQWSGHLLLPADARKMPLDRIAVFGYLSFAILLMVLLVLSRRIVRARRSSSTAEPTVNLSTPTLLILALAILPLLLTACSRPNDATLSTSASLLGNTGKFDLTAWKVEEELGPIAGTGEVYGEFPIENTGSVEVKLEAGHPTCSCSTISLDKHQLAPGETATLRMTIRRERQAGPVKASVILIALNQKWAQSFKVQGTVLGAIFPTDKMIVTKQYAADPLMIRGEVFTERPNEPCDVAVAFEASTGWEPKNTLAIGRIEFSDPKPIGKCYVRDITIPVAPVHEMLAKLDGPHTTHLIVTVTRNGKKETHLIPFEVAENIL